MLTGTHQPHLQATENAYDDLAHHIEGQRAAWDLILVRLSQPEAR